MKNIIYGKFILKPSDNAIGRFDLYEKVIRTKKESEETYEAEVNISYGSQLNSVIKTIANININETEKEGYTLKEYIEALVNELETIKKELK